MIYKHYRERRLVKGPSLIASYSISNYCCRLPRTNPNISTSQCDVEVRIEEELSDEKRTARMKKVIY